MDETKLLFALFRFALIEDAPPTGLRDALTVPTLRALYAVSKKHDLAHLLAYALDKLALTGEDAVFEKLKKQHLLAVYRYEQLRYDYEKITACLEKEKIAYLPLKGAVLRELYPQPWMRTSCDIDILVPEKEHDAAVAALVAVGYRAEERRGFHDISLYSPTGVHLELHFNIKEAIKTLDGVLSRVWEYAERVDEEHYRYRMTPAFLTFHLVAHASYHFVGGGCGIRPLIDLYFLRRSDSYPREDALLPLLSDAKLLTFYENLAHLSDAWLEGVPHTELSARMEAFLLGAGVYGTMENKIAIAQKERGGKLAYALKRIFMPYSRLKLYYPRLEKYPILLPYYEIKRWLRLLFRGRYKHAAAELKTNAAVTKEESARAFDLCERLGIK